MITVLLLLSAIACRFVSKSVLGDRKVTSLDLTMDLYWPPLYIYRFAGVYLFCCCIRENSRVVFREC